MLCYVTMFLSSVMLLGSGELGKEVIIALQRLGVEVSPQIRRNMSLSFWLEFLDFVSIVPIIGQSSILFHLTS